MYGVCVCVRACARARVCACVTLPDKKDGIGGRGKEMGKIELKKCVGDKESKQTRLLKCEEIRETVANIGKHINTT